MKRKMSISSSSSSSHSTFEDPNKSSDEEIQEQEEGDVVYNVDDLTYNEVEDDMIDNANDGVDYVRLTYPAAVLEELKERGRKMKEDEERRKATRLAKKMQMEEVRKAFVEYIDLHGWDPMDNMPPEPTYCHTQSVSVWAVLHRHGIIMPYYFKRRENGRSDVTMEILYCEISRKDLHFAQDDWDITEYPIVPGDEITGIITKVGSDVNKFKVGDKVGVECLAASCLECDFCKSSQENYCEEVRFTYNSTFWDGSPSYGGYSKFLVSDHRFVVRIPENLPMDATAPLLSAGITVFIPFKDSNLVDTPGKRVGVVGLGGLGHIAVKFGKAFGHHVTVISTSPSKEKEAKERFGADDFILSTNDQQLKAARRTLDFIVDTASAKHNLGPILELLKVNGTLAVVGTPAEPIELPACPLISGKRSVRGNMTGSISETQEMLDVCGKYNISCDIELVKPDNIENAWDRLAVNDVRYRFVIDIAEKA